ncbi:MAG: ATP-binding protein [Permianibacter sp.]
MKGPAKDQTPSWRRWRRRLWFFSYITAVGVLANALAPEPVGVMPFLLGAMAVSVVMQRLGLLWGAACLVLTMLPISTASLWLFAVAHGLAVIVLRRHLQLPFRRYLLLISAVLLPVILLNVYLQENGSRHYWLSVAILWLGLLHTELGAELIIRVVDAARGQAQPFRAVLAYRLAVAASAPLALAAVLALNRFIESDIAAHREKLTRLTASKSQAVSHHLQQHRLAIAAHAAAVTPDDEAPYRRALSVLSTSYPSFLTLLITDADGRILASHPSGLTSTTSVADRPYFLVPRRTLQPFVSDVFRGRGFGTDPIIAISAPILGPTADFHGVLEGSLDLGRLGEMIDREGREDNVQFVLLDSRRNVIASTIATLPVLSSAPRQIALLQPRHSNSNRNGSGLNAASEHLLSRSNVPFTLWQLTMLLPYAPLAQFYSLLTLLTIGGSLLIMAASQRFAARFARLVAAPLDELVVRIRELRLDDPDTLHPVNVNTTIAELQELTRDFNQLIARQTATYGELRASLTLLDTINRELEQRVQERTIELVSARDEAQQMAHAKSTFLANMSHELRTPLTAIIGFTEQALQQRGLPEETAATLRIIARNAQYLLMLVNDILDASKLEFDKLELEQLAFSPLQLVQDVLISLQPQASAKGLVLDFQPQWPLPAQVCGDSTRIKQVLFNIVGNALKFTERGGVTVSMSAEPSGQEWQLEVRDTGIGLSAEQQQRLFQPFMQADASTTRKFGGTGLGLYISRQLILRMAGTFLLQSAPGQGSHFVITLPTQQASVQWLDAASAACEQQLATESASVPSLQGRVLVADDVDDLRTLITMLVRATGADVTAVENGEQAVAAALNSPFDLILMDMHMPVMDGVTAVQRLRLSGYRQPIIALTADVMPSDVAHFRAAGCDAVLGKPIQQSALMQVLQAALVKAAGPKPEPALAAEPHETAPAPRADARTPEHRTETSNAPAAPAHVQQVLAQLKQQFAARLISEKSELTTELAQQNWPALRARLHKLKGAAGTFGYPAISATADTAYRLLQQEQYDDAATALRRLIGELSDAMP